MQPRAVVVWQVDGKSLVQIPDGSRNGIQAFLLERAVEPLKVGVVVWPPHPAAAVNGKHLVREPLREFAAVIALQGAERE